MCAAACSWLAGWLPCLAAGRPCAYCCWAQPRALQGEEPWRATDMASAVATFHACFLDALQVGCAEAQGGGTPRGRAGCRRPRPACRPACSSAPRSVAHAAACHATLPLRPQAEVKAGLAEKARTAAAAPTLAW